MAIVPFKRKLFPHVYFSATYWIIGANIVFFILNIIRNDSIFITGLSMQGISQGFVWQLLTFHLSDFDLWSVLFNMLALYFFGSTVEREMGSYHFLLFYFGIGLANGLATLGLNMVLGANGGLFFGAYGLVSAVMLAYASFYPYSTIHIMGIIPVRAPVLMLIVLGLMIWGTRGQGLFALHHLFAFMFAYLIMLLRYRLNVFNYVFKGRR